MSTSLPKSSFVVDIPGVATRLVFQEVSGLDIDTQPAASPHPTSPSYASIKLPGMNKNTDVTLKRGVVANSGALSDWLQGVKQNRVRRSNVTITLIDERGKAAKVWTLANAVPTKVASADLNASGTDVAIESLDLAFEGLTLSKPPKD
jgi:phage tail-like protein